MKQFIKKNYRKILISLFILITISVGIGVFAKYYHEYETNSLYEAENFYFSSDLLKTEGTTYDYKKGVDTIKINIFNNIDTLRYTETNIDYQVSITDINGNTIVDKNKQTINKVTGMLKGDNINDKEITFTNLPDGTYKVIATSLAPYKKTLEAIFVISNNDNNIYYEVSDSAGSTVLYLTVTSSDYKGNVNITIPSGLLPDSTDKNMASVNLDNSRNMSINLNNNSEYSFKFFKENPQRTFTKSEFIVTK